MGEDAEGAAENVSKLRKQMLALTGVDIQLDESTYKSTYQILLEISKVWGNLNDISRASVLEQLFGKRQANIGAAILENGELLQQVYETAEDSVGSAMAEQEEYQKSIQYSLDSLKAAYQGLAQTVMDSDFLKGLIDGGANLLEVLDKIIDKVGVLPTILTSLAAVGSFKGVGVFGTIKDEANSGSAALTIFHKKISDIIKDYKSVSGDKTGFQKISKGLDAIIGFNESDLKSIATYNKLIGEGIDKNIALDKAMDGASESARAFVKNSKTAIVDINTLSKTERLATISTTALGVALNVALTLGIGLVIQGIITGLTNLINAEKEAKERAEQLRKEASEIADSYEKEQDSLSKLASRYIELSSTTSDLKSEKEKLLEIQNQINESTSNEKEQVDLLNGSLRENIALMNQMEYKEATKTLSELESQYNEIQSNNLNKGGMYWALRWIDKKEAKNVTKHIEQEFVDFFNATTEYFETEWTSPSGETKILHKDILTLLTDDMTVAGEDSAEVLKNIDLIIEKYRAWEGHSNDVLDSLNRIRSSYNEVVESETKIVDAYESAQSIVNGYEEVESDISDRLFEIFENAKELRLILSGNGSATEKFAATQQLKELEAEAYQLAGTNELLRDNVKSVFQAFESGASSSVESVDDLRSAWLESLDEMQKGAISDIDKVKSAMQKLAEGENLDFGTFKELVWGLDEEGILKTIKQVGDTYNLSQEELIRLKDSIINMTKQEVIEEQERTKQIMKTAQMELEVAKAKAKRLSNPQSNSDAVLYREARAEVERLESSIKEYNRILQNDNTLISYLNSQLGNTVNITKVLEAQQKSLNEQISALKNEVTELTSKADNLLKAQEHRIDQIVDGFESEKEALEADKKLLEDQLATLEEQEETLNNIIKDYESVAKVASNAIQEEVDSLKQQQQAIEDSYNARIDALKEQKEQQEEENSLVEKELSLQEKLRDLEKAKQTKVLTYSSAQGWHYDVDKEVVAQAQSAVDDAQKVYDEAVADKLFNDRVKALEKERDEALSSFEDRIEGLEEYAQLWENISDEIIKAEEEVLAQQLLGSDWREKINNKDISLLTKYRTEYRNYNAQLKTLTNTEIEHMKQSINAKDQEIKAKQEQIDTWNKYKTQVQEAVSEIKAQHEDYIDFLNQVTVDENSDFYQREVNLWNFKEHYKAYMDEIASKNYSIDEATRKLESLTNTMANLSGGYTIDVDVNLNGLIDKLNDVSNRVADAISDAFSRLNGFSDGGTAAYTGAAILHGKPTSAETIFNASQSKELYNMVKTGDFSAMVADRAYQGISSALKSMSFNGSADNSSRVININGLTIKADNPAQFHDQFIKEIGQYWKIKLGESYAQ